MFLIYCSPLFETFSRESTYVALLRLSFFEEAQEAQESLLGLEEDVPLFPSTSLPFLAS